MASHREMTVMRTCLSASTAVACPKPRRLRAMNSSVSDQIWSSRCEINYQAEKTELKTGSELLDIILSKGNYVADYGNQMASSPPCIWGSPPSRASNPLIQNSEFGKTPFITQFPFSPPASPSACTGGSCIRTKIGQNPAVVRIEGFDCLSNDRSNCSISAVA